MKKIIVNGDKLRIALSEMSLSIVNAAKKGNIGEKTLHRILNNEPIKESIILRLFQNLGINYRDYLSEELDSSSNKEANLKIVYTDKPNIEVIFEKFTLPQSTDIPLELLWEFDITDPTEEALNLIKTFNTALSEYCSYTDKEINRLDFDSSYRRLKSNTKIKGHVDTLKTHGIYTFSGIYNAWSSRDETRSTENGEIKEKFYWSTKYLGLFLTQKRDINHVIASVNAGNPPPIRMEKDYFNVTVNEDPFYYM